MAPLTAQQRRTRRRVEAAIGLVAPALDLVLAVGDRVSRVLAPKQLGDGELPAPASVGTTGKRPARRALSPGFERAAREGETPARY